MFGSFCCGQEVCNRPNYLARAEHSDMHCRNFNIGGQLRKRFSH